MAKLNVIFEDDMIIVCKKEAGVPTQSAKVSEKDMVSIVKGYLFEKNFHRGEPYLGLIHRLDQPVEGILLLAKTPESAKGLSRQIQEGKMQKKYLAVTCGHISQKKNILRNYLRKENRSNLSKVVDEKVKDAKLSELEYIILEEEGEKNLVEINLFTGRHHQIRVQLAHLGMPIWGDTKYNPLFKEHNAWSQIALCAYHLEFEHPRTKKKLSFEIMPTADVFKKFNFIKKQE